MKFNFIETLKESFVQVVKRFPVTLCYVLAVTVLLLEMIYNMDNHPVLLYFLTAGSLLSLMLHLWGEEIKNKSLVWGTMAVTNVLLVIDSIWLNSLNDVDIHFSVYMARLSVYVAFMIGCVYLQFWKNKDDMESSNFGRRLISNMAITYLVCGVLALGLMILYSGTLFLFDIRQETYKPHLIISLMSMVFLASIMILSRIPNGDKKHDAELNVTKFYKGVLRYMFIPLVMCYMVVLYVYLFKILINWELPQGTLSTMVSIMMIGLSIVVIMLYPIIKKGGNSYEKFAARWLPLIALPIVILMTVGIVRRFSDYGITANRLYVLTLNVWFYVVCLGLFITHSRRIHWISISFAAMFLLSSAQPFNYGEIAHRVVRNRLNAALETCKVDSVFQCEVYFNSWLKSMPDTIVAKQIFNDMAYLYEENYHEDLDKIVSRDIYISSWNSPFSHDYVECDDNIFMAWRSDTYFTYDEDGASSKVKEGYSHVEMVNLYSVSKKDETILSGGRLHFNLDIDESLPKSNFDIDTLMFGKEYFFKTVDGKKDLHIRSFHVKTDRDFAQVHVNGYLFFNDEEK